MLEYLSEPLPFSNDHYPSFSIGSKLCKASDLTRLTQPPLVALITEGEDLEPYQKFRKSLYQLQAPFDFGFFVDLGGCKGGMVGITETVDFLKQRDILPVVVGKSEEIPLSLLRACSTDPFPVQLTLANARIDYPWNSKEKPNPLQQMMEFYPQFLERIHFMGFQSYFVDPLVLDFFKEKYFDCYRLGWMKSQIQESEPILRDSDILGLSMNALCFADAPAATAANPNGFSAAEACQIARYAAMSDRMKMIGICDYDPSLDQRNISAQLVAQMIWFVFQGIQQRKNEFPPDMSCMQRFDISTQPISFYRSNKSDRWWFSLEGRSRNLISCSYEDYKKTCEGDLPERILMVIDRM